MDRRSVIGALTPLILLPVSLRAQTPGKVRRIGWLGVSRIDTPQLVTFRDTFRDELRRFGWIEGRDYVLEYRFGEGHPERFPQLARELVEAKVDVMLTVLEPAALAAKEVTRTIPIVFTAANARVIGLVSNFARPDGNVTGVSSPAESDLDGKRLQLLLDMFPGIRRLGFLSSLLPERNRLTREAADRLGVELVPVDVERLDDILANIERTRNVDGWYVVSSTNFLSIRQAVVDQVTKARKPAMYGSPNYVELGGLMAYGTDFRQDLAVAARQIDRILRGARVADVPVEQSTLLGLTINLKTAKALGITFPPSVLMRAEVIE